MEPGYLPSLQTGGYYGYQVIIEEMKVIEQEGAQTVLATVGYGADTRITMERYVKWYENNKDNTIMKRVKKIRATLKEVSSIE